MTPSATPMLIDNTGPLEASETVRFGVDGRAYEIDLSARRASELRSMVGRYIRVARKIPSAPSRGLDTQRDQEQSGRTRSRTILTSPRGRSPQHAADKYQATERVTRVASQSPGTAEPQPAPAATETDVRSGAHGLTDREKQELRSISDAARPLRDIVAGRLRTKGLADRDTAGNWWLTDAGRRELASA
jgi:hypothetical protein